VIFAQLLRRKNGYKTNNKFMQNINIKIGGVPEHFNYPWHLAKQQNPNLPFTWQNFNGGTGAMIKAIETQEIDMAVMLTEGAITGINKGLNAKIVGTYVISPLIWGIHVAAGSPYQKTNDLECGTFGISRKYSGSHLMTIVNAKRKKWIPNALNFEIIGSLDGARQAFNENKIDGFLWEMFTTKHLVDSGEWRRVGICRTPWPCFVMVAHKNALKNNKEEILKIIEAVRKTAIETEENLIIDFISKKYNLSKTDILDWKKRTQWLIAPRITVDAVEYTQKVLHEVGIIESTKNERFYLADCCELRQSIGNVVD